ncbi:Prepilin leader peptidase/N-methyltransferase OS=Rhodanobacter lindaniclasticus OX=75310 GN=B1991_01640 PE=3 SV=1 [Rhodanobacter lindaniclasticus]
MPKLPLAAWIALAAVLGLLVGSFLNVVILRLPEHMAAGRRREARQVLELPADDAPLPPGIVREPSHCPHCKHPLSAADNIPLFGWLLLRGRCRYCRERKNLDPVAGGVVQRRVERAGGVEVQPHLGGAGGTGVHLGTDRRGRHRLPPAPLLPDQLTLPLLWLGLVLSLIPLFAGASSAIIGAAIGYLSLWSVYWAFKLLTGRTWAMAISSCWRRWARGWGRWPCCR